MAPVTHFGPIALLYPMDAQLKFWALVVVESAFQPEDSRRWTRRQMKLGKRRKNRLRGGTGDDGDG